MMASAAILWLCGGVVVAVFAVMIHSIATFRRDADPKAARAQPGALAEILWAIVPIFIMVGTALPAVRMLTAGDAPRDLQAQRTLFLTAASASHEADGQ